MSTPPTLPSGATPLTGLLADPVLEGAVTLAGAAGLDRGVLDIRWYDGELDGGLDDVGDCLLVCPDTRVSPPYRLDALLRRAGQRGASGILIVGGPLRLLLSSVHLADRLRLPVLRVERSSAVRLIQDLTAIARAPEQVRVRTVDHLLRRLGTKRHGREILATTGSVLRAEVSLVAADGHHLLGEPVAIDDDLRLGEVVPQRGASQLAHPVLDPVSNRVVAWLVCPFGQAAGARLDVLATGLAVAEPFVRSWLAGQRAQAERQAVLQARILGEILTSGDSVGREVIEGAVSLGWRLADWHVGIHVYSPAATDPGNPEPVLTRVATELAAHGVEVVSTVPSLGGWSLWSSTEHEPPPGAGQALLRTLRVVTAGLPREWELVVGLGRAHRGPAGLATTLTEARDAADLARSQDFRPAIEHSDELGVARLLATWQRSEMTRTFAETALAPLRPTPMLLTTLRVYLEAGCSVTEAANILGVHRNTMTARLQTIRHQLDADLDDPSQRLALQVACRALLA